MSRRTIYDRFYQWVSLQPEAVAVVEDGRSATYRELDIMANAIMSKFYSLHYPAVGIVMSHSIEMIAAMSEYGFKSRSPGSSRAQQQPRPIPSPPPVTMATFPEKSNNLSISILKKSLKSLKKKDSSLILQIPNSHQAKQLSKLK